MSEPKPASGRPDDFLSILYDSLSDEAKDMMREVFSEKDIDGNEDLE